MKQFGNSHKHKLQHIYSKRTLGPKQLLNQAFNTSTTLASEYSLRPEKMEDYRDFIETYIKIKNIIESCTTTPHLKVAKQMIENLTAICLNSHLSYDFYILYINNLKFFLKRKNDELSI